MTRLTAVVSLVFGIGCSGFNHARPVNEFHEVGRFHTPNIHALYPSAAYFVVAPETVMRDRSVVLSYSRSACAEEQVCFVHFWTDESKAASGFPITDSEAVAMVAIYNHNRSTGSDGFQCYNFGRPAERCARR